MMDQEGAPGGKVRPENRKTQVRERMEIRRRSLPIFDCKMYIYQIMFALFWAPFCLIFLIFPIQFLKTRAAPARLLRGSLGGI